MASTLLGTPSRETQAADKVCRGMTDCMTTLANEPSLGLYYVMEHIQRATPNIINNKTEMARSGDLLHGAGLDASYALDELKLATSPACFDILKRASKLAASAAETRAVKEPPASSSADLP